MYNNMSAFSIPSMECESNVYDSLLELGGVRVLYLDIGLPFLDRSYKMVFYLLNEGEEKENDGRTDLGPRQS